VEPPSAVQRRRMAGLRGAASTRSATSSAVLRERASEPGGAAGGTPSSPASRIAISAMISVLLTCSAKPELLSRSVRQRSVWAPLGQTALSRSGRGTNKSDGPWRSSRGHRCSVSAGLLGLLILLVLLLAGQSGLLRAGRNPHSVDPSDSVSCHLNQGHDRRATARRSVCNPAVEGRDGSDRAVSRVDRSYPRNLPRPK
jgi:hypothetical protein